MSDPQRGALTPEQQIEFTVAVCLKELMKLLGDYQSPTSRPPQAVTRVRELMEELSELIPQLTLKPRAEIIINLWNDLAANYKHCQSNPNARWTGCYVLAEQLYNSIK
jgi:hypothetical protein